VRADSAGLTGYYYEDDLDHPLAGALIALYNADNNLLVEYTYTRNDGGFALKAPPAKGKYYVVATRDQSSHKIDLDYDPQTPSQNLLIPHHQSKSRITKLLVYLRDKLVEGLNLLIGFLVGLLYKVYEDRRKARQVIDREIQPVKDSTAEIVTMYQNLQQAADAFGVSKDNDTANANRAEYVRLATAINSEVADLRTKLDANKNLEEAIYTAHKLGARKNYAALKRTLREITTLTAEIIADPDQILNLPSQDRDQRLQPFRNLQANDLLKDA
jgi:hypothetical protein